MSSENISERENNVDNWPQPKSHWEKYKIYYLIFGSFFLILLIIFISNSSTNSEIRKINHKIADLLSDSSDFPFNQGGGSNNPHDHGGQTSKFESPHSDRQNKNWIDEVIIQNKVNREVKKWVNTFKFLPQYQTNQKLELDNHVLFCGPPGSGKSFIIEEFCHNETSAFTLAHFETQIYAGSSIEKQQRVFKQAKKLSKYNLAQGKTKPVAIVIEEIDSVGVKDLSGNNRSSSQEVDGLLKIFDEINSKNLNIIIIGTTNNPEVINEALVRPGRLGRRIFVDYPSGEELKKLIDYCEKVMKKNWRSYLNNNDGKDKIVEWPSKYWPNVYEFVQEIGKKYHDKETGFNFRDLQKAVTGSLASKVDENSNKIIPDAQDFKKELDDILKVRVSDRENNLRNRYNIPRREPNDNPREPDKPKP